MRRVVIAGMLSIAAAAGLSASVTFDALSGTGFVGKGDIQTIYGWNNKALQDNAGNVQFRVHAESESTWTCHNTANPNPPVQNKTHTDRFEGVIDEIARDNSRGKNGPVTGFILNGYNGNPQEHHTGVPLPPAPGSCPSGPWVYDDNLVTVTVPGGGLQVSINGSDWFSLQ